MDFAACIGMAVILAWKVVTALAIVLFGWVLAGLAYRAGTRLPSSMSAICAPVARAMLQAATIVIAADALGFRVVATALRYMG